MPVAREKNTAMDLPLEPKLKIGVQTIHRRTEPATDAWRRSIDARRELVKLIEGCVDDNTIEEDRHRGRHDAHLQCAKDSRRSIPLLAGCRKLTLY